MDAGLWHEILLNGSIVLLLGLFPDRLDHRRRGLAEIDSFIVAPFKGVLCLFLLDMGLVAGRGLREGRAVFWAPGALAFGVIMPLIGRPSGWRRACCWACRRAAWR